jgi:5'-3' exonuclease
MGVKDLLKMLDSESQSGNVQDFKGGAIAIDASGWLHRSVYGIVDDLVDKWLYEEDNKKNERRMGLGDHRDFNSTDLFSEDEELYVDFFLKRAYHFRRCGVEPVFIFDGKRHVLKGETQEKRRDTRRAHVEHGRKLLDAIILAGDDECRRKLRMEAVSNFQKGLGATHEMELHVISSLRRMGVDIVVAPFEADVQLVNMCRMGRCQAILTEDSDVLVYIAIAGLSVPILTKFDKTGSVKKIDLSSVMDFHEEKETEKPSIALRRAALQRNISNTSVSSSDSHSNTNANELKDRKQRESNLSGAALFSDRIRRHFRGPHGRRMFVQTCILAGCDYSESLKNVGLITAMDVVLKFRRVACDCRLKRICSYFANCKAAKEIPYGYLERCRRAEALFYYQLVYNPADKSICNFMLPRMPCVVRPISTSSHLSQGEEPSGLPSASVLPLPLSLPSSDVLLSNAATYGQMTTYHPLVSADDVDRIGTIQSVLELSCANDDYIDLHTIEDLCAGYRSWQNGCRISPSYPWERRPSLKKMPIRFTEKASLNGKYVKALPISTSWHIRMNLIGFGHKKLSKLNDNNSRSSSSSDYSSAKPKVYFDTTSDQDSQTSMMISKTIKTPYQESQRNYSFGLANLTAQKSTHVIEGLDHYRFDDYTLPQTQPSTSQKSETNTEAWSQSNCYNSYRTMLTKVNTGDSHENKNENGKTKMKKNLSTVDYHKKNEVESTSLSVSNPESQNGFYLQSQTVNGNTSVPVSVTVTESLPMPVSSEMLGRIPLFKLSQNTELRVKSSVGVKKFHKGQQRTIMDCRPYMTNKVGKESMETGTSSSGLVQVSSKKRNIAKESDVGGCLENSIASFFRNKKARPDNE